MSSEYLRKIDMLVAEKVLQWKRGRTGYGEMPWKAPNGKGYLMVPRFSSDADVALEVEERLLEDGWAITVKKTDEEYIVTLANGEESLWRSAPTRCLALCLCALDAYDRAYGD